MVLVYKGRALLQEGRLDAALEELLAASTANPSDVQALLLLAYAYYRLGETSAAMQQLDLAHGTIPIAPIRVHFAPCCSAMTGTRRRSPRVEEAVKRNEALVGTRFRSTALIS